MRPDIAMPETDARPTTCVALIPARSGSKRVPGKNVRILNGHPLLAYAVAAARESGVFTEVVVSTDSPDYATIAHAYGARCIARPTRYATDTSPDIDWIRYTLARMEEMLWRTPSSFSILRPTSPFRTAETIRRAWARWCEKGAHFDSLRAVEPCGQHPWKMWRYETTSSALVPLMAGARGWEKDGTPGHSRQYADLPPILAQNASLEIAWVRTVTDKGSIAGEKVLPFFTRGHEGMDVNRPGDWDAVELLLSRQQASLPQIRREWTSTPLDPYDPHGTGVRWHLDRYDPATQRQMWIESYAGQPLPEGLREKGG